MKIPNFKEKIELYLKANPNISHDKLGVLLLIENLYKDQPKDIFKFRELYPHLDPQVIDHEIEGIAFTKIAQEDRSPEEIKNLLNSYINVKYNYLGNFRTYKENMKKFKIHCEIISSVLDDVLETGKFPHEVIKILREKEEVRKCKDFYQMLQLYKTSDNKRTKFEILRKIGLIVLLSRITRRFMIQDVDFIVSEVNDVFKCGLGLQKKEKHFYYLWIDENDKVHFSENKIESEKSYKEAVRKRKEHAMPVYPMQVFEYHPYKTKFGGTVLFKEIRNKLRRNGDLCYTSFIEKIVRKNLEFPNQVHDLIGVKLITKREEDIPTLIRHLETFLGGSSTRKQEKNTLHRFGKKKLGRYSSKEYFVWKAIYDIALPHPSILKVKKLLELTKGNEIAQKELRSRLAYFKDKPQDNVVEVQIQDISSYLLSIAKGSPTDHDFLKMNQVRSNSFYKFFPKEIYEGELVELRKRILKNGK